MRGSIKVMLGLGVQTRDLSAALQEGKTASLPFLKNNSITFSDFDIDTKEERGYVMTMSVPRIRLPNGMMVEQSPELSQLRFEAVDAENKRWRVRRGPVRLTQGSQAQFTLSIRPIADDSDDAKRPKPPTKFSVLIPSRTEECQIPFEFNDLPVPAFHR